MARTTTTTNKASTARANQADDDRLGKRYRSTQQKSVDSTNVDSCAAVTYGSIFSNKAHQGQTCNSSTTSNKSNINGGDFAKPLPPHHRKGFQTVAPIFRVTDGGLFGKISSDDKALATDDSNCKGMARQRREVTASPPYGSPSRRGAPEVSGPQTLHPNGTRMNRRMGRA